MKTLIIALLAGLAALLVRASRVLAYTSTSPNSATFSTSDMIPEYKDPGTRQWGQRVANNTAYNWRHSDQNIVIAGQFWNNGDELQFDTSRDYTGSTICVIGYTQGLAALDLPLYQIAIEDYFIAFRTLTTTYQSLLYNSDFQIRAEGSSGFTIKCNVAAGRAFAGIIFEGRLATGA